MILIGGNLFTYKIAFSTKFDGIKPFLAELKVSRYTFFLIVIRLSKPKDLQWRGLEGWNLVQTRPWLWEEESNRQESFFIYFIFLNTHLGCLCISGF